MSELVVMSDVLPELAITVDTVSIPVLVVDAPQEIVVDLGVPSLTRSHHARMPAPVPATAHVGLWWANIQGPIVPRMSAGWRARVLLTVTAVIGSVAFTVGMVAWLGGWIR